MIVADVLGPWWDVEATDGEGNSYRDRRRLPQFIHDIGDMPFRDVTAQLSEVIPPTPGLCAWRVWCSEAQLAQLVEHAAYEVLRDAVVDAPHRDPTDWPATVARTAETPAGDAFPPLPDAGTPLAAGAIYQHGEQAVIVRQPHTRTEHAPEDVPALFMVYRADASSVLAWVAGEPVTVGMLRTYGDVTYECRQSHVTQADWMPPETPALWAVVEEAQEPGGDEPTEWAVGVSYDVGDVVTYQGAEYECRQAHTSQAGWTPSAVPALWLRV